MITTIKVSLKHIFPYITINKDVISASSTLNKGGKPNVRIDSKVPVKALMLGVGSDNITIKSVVNSTGEKGLMKEIMKSVFKAINPDVTINILQDVSNGFWDDMISKNPQYNWSKVN